MEPMNTKPKGIPLTHFVMPDTPFGNTHYNIAVWGTCGAGKTAQVKPILHSIREQMGLTSDAVTGLPANK